jgi:transaldolase
MKIYLATARLDDIRWAAEGGLVDGIVTTPGLLAAERGADGRELLGEICRTSSVPVCASVGAVSAADIFREGRELARIDDRLVVQVPLVEDATGAIRRLTAEGVHVGAMLVFNAAQAVLAAKAGATMVTVPVDQLDTYGHSGIEAVTEIRAVFDTHGIECDIMAASPQNAAQFTSCAIAGSDAALLHLTVLRSLLVHPLTDRGIDQFLSELSKRPKVRAPL